MTRRPPAHRSAVRVRQLDYRLQWHALWLVAPLLGVCLSLGVGIAVGAAPATEDTAVPAGTDSVVDAAGVATDVADFSGAVGDVVEEAPEEPDAAALLADVYALPPHPPVRLPAELDWQEDPFEDYNWQFQLHSLRWSRALLTEGGPAAEAYQAHWTALVRDWLAANPPDDPAGAYAWNDHATAWRALTLADATATVGTPDWLRDALELHGRVLADEDFYVDAGNHALNQATGLLAVACVTEHADWQQLAVDRLAELVVDSVDADGATNEQAVEYQLYNYARYEHAAERLDDCGVDVPQDLERVAAMPELLAHAVMPSGAFAQLGDTDRRDAAEERDTLAGTVAEYAATGGAAGPHPGEPWAVFADAGFAFGRTGWGEQRPFADEVAHTLRFGPPRAFHGHLDHTDVTLAGYGTELLAGRGKYAYRDDDLRAYITSRDAHNVVTVDGSAFDPDTTTELVTQHHDDDLDHHVVTHAGYPGVTVRREVVFSRALGYLVVRDDLTADEPRTFRQLWQLHPDAAPTVVDGAVMTRRDRGNLALVQLGPDPVETTIVTGRESPRQGWQSFGYGEAVPAPTVEAVAEGESVSYLTLLVPAEGAATLSLTGVGVDEAGFGLTVTVGEATERVEVGADGARITQP